MAEQISVNDVHMAPPRMNDANVKLDQSAHRLAQDAKASPKAEQAKAAQELQAELKAQNKEMDEAQKEAQKEALKDSFKGLNSVMSDFAKSIRFATFEQSGELYAQVINTSTDEVVKTIPSEEALEMMNRLNNVLGMLVDTEG
jgi:flagellar protein FlaG